MTGKLSTWRTPQPWEHGARQAALRLAREKEALEKDGLTSSSESVKRYAIRRLAEIEKNRPAEEVTEGEPRSRMEKTGSGFSATSPDLLGQKTEAMPSGQRLSPPSVTSSQPTEEK